MMTLLCDELAPVTFKIGFLQAPFETVCRAFLEWKGRHLGRIESKRVSQPFREVLAELEPLTTVPRRWLLLPTSGDWTAYFDNSATGPDPTASVGYLSSELKCRGVVAVCIPHTLDEECGRKLGVYGAVQFELFSPDKTEFLNYDRTVSVAYDSGKWRFDANGKIQSFEENARYQSRRIRDRFTRGMLIRYCKSLGIVVDSPEFYRSPSLLISSGDPIQNRHAALSIAGARDRMGLN